MNPRVQSAHFTHVRERAFTLVELLIALTILSLLAVLGYRAVASLAETESRLAREAERWRALDLLFARLESDCRETVPRPARDGDTRRPAFAAIADERGNAVLELSRADAEFVLEPGSAGQRIGYRVRDDVVEILYWPTYDVPRSTVPAAYELVHGVTALRAAYLDGHGAWRERWPVPREPDLPRAMRVSLQLADGGTIERVFALQ